MAIGDLISATDYNSIRTNTDSVLGATTLGYGQTLRSSAVASSSLVTSNNMQLLYLDIMSAKVHQTGALNTTVVYPAIGDLIAWDTSTAPDATKKGINDFITLNNSVVSFDFQTTRFPDACFSISSLSSSSRNGTTNPWGTAVDTQTITHEVVITFTNANHMQYFFNAGGEIRFSSSLTSAVGAKSVDWSNMLAAMGSIAFNKWQTRSLNSSGTGTSIGSNNITSTYQTIYTKYGSSVYSDNFYTISARKPSVNTLRFLISFTDGDVGTDLLNPVDENVTGTVTSLVQSRQPNSSFTINSTNYTAVSVANPTTTLISGL